MRELTIIGAGNVGTTLGIQFARHGYPIRNIYSRTQASAERAALLIGQGKVVANLRLLAPMEIAAIAASDDALMQIGSDLERSDAVRPGTIVFHCSGTISSSVFEALRKRGAHIASVHPIKTFTSPLKDADTFSGTWCGFEGDTEALAVLEPLYTELGANIFRIDGTKKTLYHTAIVFICNYLFPLIEIGFQCYEEAGIPRSLAAKFIDPILHATVANALTLGPAKALTGPIARGDTMTIEKQLEGLEKFKPGYSRLYKILGELAVGLSVEKGAAAPEKLEAMRKLLKNP